MTTDQTADRALRAVLTVTIETRPDGRYYVDCDDLLSHVIPWVEGTLEDRDGIVGVTVAEAPLSPDYEHPECGFHWHGRDGMDIPIRDGQPVCPRCELAKVEKKLAYVQRMRDEVGAECKRRGKTVLEHSEKNRALERQLDEVRRQLGAEILRTNHAETELRRVAAEEQPAAGCWCGHPQDRHWAGSTRMTFPDGCHDCRGWNGAHAYGQELPWADNEPDAARPAVGEQPETQETLPPLVDELRGALAKADGFNPDGLEAHDYQAHAAAVRRVVARYVRADVELDVDGLDDDCCRNYGRALARWLEADPKNAEPQP